MNNGIHQDSPRRLRLLIVEDSEDDAFLLIRELRKGGYEVVSERVETPEAMKAALDEQEWDLVIADYVLPVFSGLAALDVLRESGLDLPFIIVSGNIGEDIAVDAMKAGAHDYIMKGRLKRLIPAVERELREAGMRRERRKAKDALIAERQRLYDVLELLPAYVVLFTKDHRAPFANRFFRERFRDARGRQFFEWLYGRNELCEDCEPFTVLETMAPHHWEWVGPDGRNYDIHDFPFTDTDGETLVLEMGIDVTERKQAGEMLREANENLEQRVAERTAELEASRAQLAQAQKMEAVGRLAGGISHDFNNLLSVILGYGEIALARSSAGHPLYEPLREIHKAALKARKLTYQLLAFSRKQVLEVQEVDINRLVAGFEKMIGRVIGEDIDISLRLASTAVPVMADRAQLEQVLMNLAVNARDAMPEGGRLAIETAITDLDESYASDKPGILPGKYAMIAVTDTGIGIPPDNIDNIFEPFFTTKEKDKGTGLGLATSYGIIKQHGGNIWVYSEPDRGATFKIYLPLAPGEAEKEAPSENCALANVSATILMVEDEPAVRKLTHTLLDSEGYCVLSSGSAAEAVDLAKNHDSPIHLLLSDVIMPGMKGPEVYRRVLEYYPGIKVVYMSGYTQNEIARQGVLEKGVYFIQKPFTVNELTARINSALREK